MFKRRTATVISSEPEASVAALVVSNESYLPEPTISLEPNSYFPLFKGAKAIEQSYANADKPAGISVHWVSEELDGGSVIAQKELPRIEGEAFESFKNRIHLLEYELLPHTVVRLLQ